jgi:glycosyltransferase involved in cell wall biosynthesis
MTGKLMPKVSVIVPNYNHARFLPQRLDSIFAQTFKDYELIVLDDASSDNSREVLKYYTAKIPMRLVFNERNSGSPFAQWQKAAALANGEYLWIAESDDYADPKLLQTLVSELQRNPKVGLAYCQSFGVNEKGQILGKWGGYRDLEPERWQNNYVNQGADEVARYLVIKNTIPNASAIVLKRDVFCQAVQNAEKFRLTGDWWTWSRMLMQSDVAYVSEPLNFFRTHDCSVRDTTKLSVAALEYFTVMAYIFSQVQVSATVRRLAFREAFYEWCRCFDSPAFRPEWQWLHDVYTKARCINRSAIFEMAWFLFKVKLKRVAFVAATVRTAKKFCGLSHRPTAQEYWIR